LGVSHDQPCVAILATKLFCKFLIFMALSKSKTSYVMVKMAISQNLFYPTFFAYPTIPGCKQWWLMKLINSAKLLCIMFVMMKTDR